MSYYCEKINCNCKYCDEKDGCIFDSQGSGNAIDMPCYEETLYLCDKKKECNKSLSCINGLCMYTTDPNHRANKGIKEKIANAKPSSSLFRKLTESMTEEEILETVIQAKVRARLYEWLESFNTNSAPQCFNAVQELKKRLEDMKND